MIENRNMILAVVLSVAILLGFEFYNASKRPVLTPEQLAQQTQTQTQNLAPAPTAGGQAPSLPTTGTGTVGVPAVPGAIGTGIANVESSRGEILAANHRVAINAPRLHGSIALTGGRIDDLTLADYREEIDPTSPEIILLSPKGSSDAYYAQFGWVAATGAKVPEQNTVWSSTSSTLTPETPITLRWDNGEGLTFTRTIALDDNFMFTVTQNVTNTGSAAHTLHPYGLISRHGTPDTTDFYILHEGPLGVFEGTLTEVDYDEVQESGQIKQSSTGGWIGFTDKYWLAALVPDQNAKFDTRFTNQKNNNADVYQTDYLGAAISVPVGGSVETTNRLFAGAKEVLLLDKYEEEIGVKQFDLAIDFGWFYFLTKPIFYALLWINQHVTNLGFCILILTVAIKLCLFPLANKSYVSMSKMKKLQPEMTKLRERYGDDKMKLNQEMMALYKREKANPASGCLPILIQIPVFFALYKVLFVTIEMRHAPFFGWIHDLSAPDPTSLFNLFGLIPWTPPEFLIIGVWPIIMGVTMYLQQKLNPQPTDPIQAKVFLFLPLMFTFMLGRFPAGLVIYWAWNNTLSIAQQWYIMRRQGLNAKEALS